MMIIDDPFISDNRQVGKYTALITESIRKANSGNAPVVKIISRYDKRRNKKA